MRWAREKKIPKAYVVPEDRSELLVGEPGNSRVYRDKGVIDRSEYLEQKRFNTDSAQCSVNAYRSARRVVHSIQLSDFLERASELRESTWCTAHEARREGSFEVSRRAKDGVDSVDNEVLVSGSTSDGSITNGATDDDTIAIGCLFEDLSEFS